MDSDRLNRWLGLGASLGVLIGIALLILELDQNREAMRAQTRHDLSMALIDSMKPMIESTEFASIHRRGDAVGEELTADELWQLQFHYRALFRYWENVYFQYQIGTYDEVEFRSQFEAMAGVINRPFASKVWCEYRSRLSVDFSEQLDLRFDGSC